jgi:quercetin dioxygenase-like cupin family protein
MHFALPPSFRRILLCAVVSVVPLPVAAGDGPNVPADAIQIRADDVVWSPGPPTLPEGTRMMVLEGDPRKEGLFTIRLQIPAGTRLQPHRHPREERATILSGEVRVGFGDAFDEADMTAFGPGSYYVNPPKSHHYVWIVEDSVMQLTGMGPWELHYLKP